MEAGKGYRKKKKVVTVQKILTAVPKCFNTLKELLSEPNVPVFQHLKAE